MSGPLRDKPRPRRESMNRQGNDQANPTSKASSQAKPVPTINNFFAFIGDNGKTVAKYDPIVDRQRAGSWRTSGNAPEALRKTLYQEMLREELGRDPAFRFSEAEEDGWGELLSRPLSIIILAVITFMLVFGVLLWRDGAFDRFFRSGKTAQAASAWVLGDRQRGPEDLAPTGEPEDAPTSKDSKASKSVDSSEAKSSDEDEVAGEPAD
jgi:hypothetical protein